jgi:sugar transferase (PEP-CTERM/EpsH1 system associated)
VNSRPDVLFVSHRVPYPPDKGNRARAFYLVRLLGRYADVHLAAFTHEAEGHEASKGLSGECAQVTAIPASRWSGVRAIRSLALGGTMSEGASRSSQLATTIRHWSAGTRFAVAVASETSVAHYLRLPGLEQATKLVDMVSLESLRWSDEGASTWPPKSWAFLLEGGRLGRLEKSICTWANVVTLASESEAATMRELTGTANIHAITSGVDLQYFCPSSPGAETGCVFVGDLSSGPDVAGIGWFARAVWPNVRQRWPEVRLTILGRKPGAAAKELAEIPGVDVVGHMTDVRPYLDQAAVVVAPQQAARGLQSSVLEAMAVGKPVVASPAVLAGFGQRPDLPPRSATEPADWVETIHALLGDQEARHHLGRAGRAYVELHHNWLTCLRPFVRLLGGDEPVARGRVP